MAGQERLLMEIKSLSDSIREKHEALKSGIIEREKYLDSTFRPIVEPLKEITGKLDSSLIKKENTDPSSIKNLIDFKEDDEVSNVSNMEEGDSNSSITSPTDLSVLGTDISTTGKLSRQYVVKMLDEGESSRNYHVYGARVANGGLMIGNSKLVTDDKDNIIIKDKKYPPSRGLFELIFKKNPTLYTERDLQTYKRICKSTNTHRKQYSSTGKIHRTSTGKYKKIISKLFPPQTKGSGMLMKDTYDTNVIYYNNINKLVDRMKLLHEAQGVGHTGVGNEMVALIAELRSRGYIN